MRRPADRLRFAKEEDFLKTRERPYKVGDPWPEEVRRFMTVDAQSPHTLIFYESPYRLQACLDDALAVYGDRRAAVANDLTKMFETMYRGRLGQLIERFKTEPIRGEYVIVIEGLSEKDTPPAED